ncbi:MAG: hypothetical protein N3G20_05905, partial [Verrucomicrobiae bacterium]|nr:hypothetical protein [Verrucomicrobiae bacterium]
MPGATATGDGKIGVKHGDMLRVTYTDQSPPGERTHEARVDMQPPVITEVTFTNRFGRTTVYWRTDEPASSHVVYGPTGQLQFVEANLTPTVKHEIELPTLEAGRIYQFYVVSTDLAGNTSTNNNAGRYYSFVAPQAAPVLLLYSPESTWNEFFGTLFGDFPGIECWTETLDHLGIDYEIWNIEERGVPPTAEDLSPFRAVLWRPEELGQIPEGLPEAISEYLGRGGSLCVFSFDLLTRLRDSGPYASFQTNTLHVTSFVEDGGATLIVAEPGDPIVLDLQFELDYSGFPDASWLGIYWEDGVDHITAAADAAPLFRESSGKVVAIRYPRIGSDSRNRVVFCSFPFEAVPTESPSGNLRIVLLGSIIEFLVPGLRGLPSIAMDKPVYTIPSAVTVEVTDANRAGQRFVTIELRSPAQQLPVTLRLDETIRTGVFRGVFGLQPTNVPVGPTELRVRPNDTFT